MSIIFLEDNIKHFKCSWIPNKKSHFKRWKKLLAKLFWKFNKIII